MIYFLLERKVRILIFKCNYVLKSLQSTSSYRVAQQGKEL